MPRIKSKEEVLQLLQGGASEELLESAEGEPEGELVETNRTGAEELVETGDQGDGQLEDQELEEKEDQPAEPVPADEVTFVRQEFAGVSGVRRTELTKRANELGLDRGRLKITLSELQIELVDNDFPEGAHYLWPAWKHQEPRGALERLLGYSEWGTFFRGLCEGHIDRLRAQIGQFQGELEEHGASFKRWELEDELLELAGELHPDTPVGSEDPKAILFREIVAWLRARLELEQLEEFTEGLDPLWNELSLSGFRQELRRRAAKTMKGAAA